MRCIVERLEGETALLEDEEGRRIERPLSQLPPVKEGDALVEEDGVWRPDPERTQALRARARARLERLKRRKTEE